MEDVRGHRRVGNRFDDSAGSRASLPLALGFYLQCGLSRRNAGDCRSAVRIGLIPRRTYLVADGSVVLLESLVHERSPSDATLPPCSNRLGIVAVGDILVADNALVRPRRIYRTLFSSLVRPFGESAMFASTRT